MIRLGDTAITAFKKRMGIASPSAVAERETFNVPRGQKRGLDKGRGMVQASAERLGAAVELGLRVGQGERSTQAPGRAVVPIAAPQRGAAAQRAAAPSYVFQFAEGAIRIGEGAAASAEQVKQGLREAVEELLERAAVQMGAAV